MDILLGFKHLVQGFRLIFKPGLRKFFLIPLLINMLVFSVLIWISIGQFGNLLGWMLPTGDSWWIEFIRTVLWLLFTVSEMLILFFLFTLVANLISSPFNGLLAEKVEAYLTGGNPREDTGGVHKILADILPSLLNEVRKLIYFIVLSGLVLILYFIPVINIVFPVVWLFFASWMLAMEYISYPMENHGKGLKQVRKSLAKKRLASLGFGLVVMGVTLIPLINFLVIPAAIAGATSLWVEQWSRESM